MKKALIALVCSSVLMTQVASAKDFENRDLVSSVSYLGVTAMLFNFGAGAITLVVATILDVYVDKDQINLLNSDAQDYLLNGQMSDSLRSAIELVQENSDSEYTAEQISAAILTYQAQ